MKFLMCVYLSVLSTVLSVAPGATTQKEFRLTNKLRVCNNPIVHNINGTYETVYNAGLNYLKWVKANEKQLIPLFTGEWKNEFFRVMGPKVPECPTLTVFGNEQANYDEAKRFCFIAGRKEEDKCSAYSIGKSK